MAIENEFCGNLKGGARVKKGKENNYPFITRSHRFLGKKSFLVAEKFALVWCSNPDERLSRMIALPIHLTSRKLAICKARAN